MQRGRACRWHVSAQGGLTALAVAASAGHTHAAALLLDRGADLEAKDEVGQLTEAASCRAAAGAPVEPGATMGSTRCRRNCVSGSCAVGDAGMHVGRVASWRLVLSGGSVRLRRMVGLHCWLRQSRATGTQWSCCSTAAQTWRPRTV